jgi:hypothetical protein
MEEARQVAVFSVDRRVVRKGSSWQCTRRKHRARRTKLSQRSGSSASAQVRELHEVAYFSLDRITACGGTESNDERT